MPTITPDQAIAAITEAIEQNPDVDELLEIDESIFRQNPFSEAEAYKDVRPLVQRLVHHVRTRKAPDEIRWLFRLIFTNYRNVWYNEEDEVISFNEEADESAWE